MNRRQDPARGTGRIVEGEPLPFDPVPPMCNRTSIPVTFGPGRPDGRHEMEPGFLRSPG